MIDPLVKLFRHFVVSPLPHHHIEAVDLGINLIFVYVFESVM